MKLSKEEPIVFSGFPEDFSGVTNKNHITNERMLLSLNNLEDYLSSQGQTIGALEYLYYLYIDQNMSASRIMDHIGDFLHYTNETQLQNFLSNTLGWKKNQSLSKEKPKVISEDTVHKIEEILLTNREIGNKRKPDFDRIGNKKALYKTRLLFEYLGICSIDNFENIIIELREKYGAKACVKAINNILEHEGVNFKLVQHSFNSLDQNDNLEIAKEIWEGAWATLFHEKVASGVTPKLAFYGSAREVAESDNEYANAMSILLDKWPNNPNSFFKGIVRDESAPRTFIGALSVLGMDTQEAKKLVQGSMKRNRDKYSTVVLANTNRARERVGPSTEGNNAKKTLSPIAKGIFRTRIKNFGFPEEIIDGLMTLYPGINESDIARATSINNNTEELERLKTVRYISSVTEEQYRSKTRLRFENMFPNIYKAIINPTYSEGGS